jgi:hypothetical protein
MLVEGNPIGDAADELASADLRCSMACPAKVLAIELEA